MKEPPRRLRLTLNVSLEVDSEYEYLPEPFGRAQAERERGSRATTVEWQRLELFHLGKYSILVLWRKIRLPEAEQSASCASAQPSLNFANLGRPSWPDSVHASHKPTIHNEGNVVVDRRARVPVGLELEIALFDKPESGDKVHSRQVLVESKRRVLVKVDPPLGELEDMGSWLHRERSCGCGTRQNKNKQEWERGELDRREACSVADLGLSREAREACR
jgi:hypothetical protein